MMQRFFRGPSFPNLVTLAVALLIAATPAWAGEFFEKNGVALRGFDVVAYFSEKKPVKGLAEHKADYKGSTFHFASQANRDAFAVDPAEIRAAIRRFLRVRYGGWLQGGDRSGGIYCHRRQALSELQPRCSRTVERRHPRVYREGGQELAHGFKPDQSD